MSASADPLLPTDPDTHDGETAYDVGLRHGLDSHAFYNLRIPRRDRRAYARGYARGVVKRAQRKKVP